MSGRGYEGSKYVQGRSTKEVARLIRQDIKEGKANGTYPKGLKVSVRYESFSGGSSIECQIVGLPKGFPVYSHYKTGQSSNDYSSELVELRRSLLAVAMAYRWDDSDAMTDYYDVNFYTGGFDLDWEFEKNLRNSGSDYVL